MRLVAWGQELRWDCNLVSGSSDEKKMAAKAVNSMDDVRQAIKM